LKNGRVLGPSTSVIALFAAVAFTTS
jgi:hypothetical protein